VQRQHPGRHHLGEDDAEHGLQPEDAIRRSGKFNILLLDAVRSVVGGDDIDSAVAQAGHEGLHISAAAQGGIHLEIGVVLFQRLLGESQVVRHHLTGHPYPIILGAAHQFNPLGRGDVGDMDMSAGEFGQGNIAGDHHRLGNVGDARQAQPGRHPALVHVAAGGQIGLLTVVDYRHAEHVRILERVPHHRGAFHRTAIVGKGDRSGPHQLGHLGDLLALALFGHRRNGKHLDELLLSAFFEKTHHLLFVAGRFSVGHGADRRDPAGHGCRAAAFHGLLVLAAGFAQMNVHVDQAGHDHLAAQIEQLALIIGRQIGTHAGDAAIDDQEIQGLALAAGQVEHLAALKQDFGGFLQGFHISSRKNDFSRWHSEH